MADETSNGKRMSRMSQADMPRGTLKEAVALAEALRDNFAGKDASGIDLAKALNRSPTSSSWRFLTGAAVAYGLTDAAYNAASISLTPLGAKIVIPTEEGESDQALREALMRPAIPRVFYEKYNGAKIPKDDIAKNVLVSLGIPHDRTDEAFSILIKNAKYAEILTEAGGSAYIQLRGTTSARSPVAAPIVRAPQENGRDFDFHIPIMEEKMYIEIPEALHKRSFLDDDLNDDLRALIKKAHEFAQKHIKRETPDQEPGAG